MTNGEKIKAILKPREYQIKIYGDWVEIEIQCLGINFSCGLEWWSAEYKEPNKSEIPTGSTTKTCRTCKNFGSHHGICEICKDNKCWTEKEPTAGNDSAVDCISRKAAEDITWQDPSYTDPLNILTEVRDKIRELPSVTPQEPKTGHWISHREHCENIGVIPSGLGAYEWCSNCDCGIDVREWHRNHYNYCPNCGADMRGEEV